MSLLVRSHGLRILRLRELRISSNHCFTSRFQFDCYYSTSTTTADEKSHFMVDYLINSLGFSRQEAISASSKVSHLKSTHQPDSVINLFKQVGGLDQTHLKTLVSSVPKLLLHKPDKTLEPKIRLLRDLGLSGSNLVKLIKGNPVVLASGLDTCILPTISYLRQLMGGSDAKLVKVINRDSRLLSHNTLKLLPPNIVLLQQNYGFSNDQIEWLLVNSPRTLLQKSDRVLDVVHMVERELGIPRNSRMFMHGFRAASSLSRSTMESKFCVFRSFGWSDADIFAMGRAMPSTLTDSEVTIRQRLNFYMKEVGCTPAYLASHPALMKYSFDKRVKPRYQVLKVLKDLKLVKSDKSLYTVVMVPEEKFVEGYLLPHKDVVPNLLETYTNSIKQPITLVC